RIVQLPVAQTPGCRTFLCQHFTRALVWRPEYRVHPLGAQAIAAVAVITDELHDSAARYAAIFDDRPAPIAEGLLVQTGTAPIALTSRWKLGHRLDGTGLPLRAKPLVGALFVRVADRAHAAEQLRRGGFSPIAQRDGSYAVSAEEACGVTLVFG
ncbi:MAG: hypothetical protein OEW98_11625, partial [Betaproteobacteria bacterium]|nr:hypothetical protein [Betaproteobacteria bacterium]